jgi:hypothetical protein
MKVKTVVLERVGGRKIIEKSIFVAIVVHLMNIISGVILPFIMGFYFARTQNLLFFLYFLFAIFLEFRMEYKGETLKIRIMRLF